MLHPVINFFCPWYMQDVNSATNVHHNLQGAVIPSSGSVGMRIQYPFFLFSCLIYGLLEFDITVFIFTFFFGHSVVLAV